MGTAGNATMVDKVKTKWKKTVGKDSKNKKIGTSKKDESGVLMTDISIVLDASGSMCDRRDATIDSFSNFVREQREGPGKARLSLVSFNQIIRVDFDGFKLKDVVPLNAQSYCPDGTTALYDAIGHTVKLVEERLAKRVASRERKGKKTERVDPLVVIITDGLENSSKRFDADSIKQLIATKEKEGWRFLFMGTTQESAMDGYNLGIDRGRVMAMGTSPQDYRRAQSSLSRRVMSSRERQAACAERCRVDAALRFDEKSQVKIDQEEPKESN